MRSLARALELPSAFTAAVSGDAVSVVRFATDGAGEDLMDVLDEHERRRAREFVFDADRQRFIAAHAWTRVVLGRLQAEDSRGLTAPCVERQEPKQARPAR